MTAGLCYGRQDRVKYFYVLAGRIVNGMYGQDLGKALYTSNLRVQQLRLLSASAISIQADTSFAGYLRVKKHNQ